MKTYPDHLDVPPRRHAHGEVALPGSKSISNRVLLLAALSEGVTEISGLLDSDDTRVMLAALSTLGIGVEPLGGDRCRIVGGGGVFPNREAKLFLGNAGTAFRPLTAALAFSRGRYELSGVPRMHERPIGDLVDALRQAGCTVSFLANEGYPPLLIEPRNASATGSIGVRGDVSSQFLSAMLMALPLSAPLRRVEVVGELISKPYVDITTNLMARFGVSVERDAAGAFAVPADARYVSPGRIRVEGDASSASYFLAAGALGGGPVRVTGVGRDSIQGDVRFADALKRMGAQVTWGENWIEAAAPSSGRLVGLDLDCNHIPDAAMTLAVLALFAEGPSVLRNIASWRVKETDRLAAMATELRKFGANVEEGADYLRVTPPATVQSPATGIDTYDDHRIAMCFSLASLGGIPVTINEPRCVAKTFPDFFEAFAKVVA